MTEQQVDVPVVETVPLISNVDNAIKKAGGRKKKEKEPIPVKYTKKGTVDKRQITAKINLQKAHNLVKKALEKNKVVEEESETESESEPEQPELELEEEGHEGAGPIESAPRAARRTLALPPSDSEDSDDELYDYTSKLWAKKLDRKNRKINDLMQLIAEKDATSKSLKTAVRSKIQHIRASNALKF